MNVATITMPKEEAAAKLAAYREQNRKRVDDEYQAAEAGFAALAEGTPLISLSEAIRNGGFDEKMRPKLAVARADRNQVYFRWHGRSIVATFNTNKNLNARHWDTLLIDVDMGRAHGLKRHVGTPQEYDAVVEGFALVPMVPADVRESVSVQLADCLILWEVEQWADRRISSKPDRDPYLLRHIGGDLYAVIAEWDLTELERLVMAGRRDG